MIKAHWAIWFVMVMATVGAGIINAGNADIIANQKLTEFLVEQDVEALAILKIRSE